MANTGWVIKVEMKPAFRDIQGRYTKALADLKSEYIDGLRDQGRRLHRLTVEEAPKRTGEFADNIRWRTYQGSNRIGVSISTPKPLGDFIVGGTKAHSIPRSGTANLYFFWPKGFAGAKYYHFKSVWHPGTKANKFVGRAYRRWLPGARRFLATISRNFEKRVSA